MITYWAPLNKGVDATADGSCDDADMQYVEWWLAVETLQIFCAWQPDL